MVVDIVNSASNSPFTPRKSHPLFKADALTLKIVTSLLLGFCIITAYAYLKNGQRNLTESIRREEIRNTELLHDLMAENSRWNKCNTTPALSEKLAARGFAVGLPDASQIVYVTPARGHHRGGTAHISTAVASR